MTDSSAVTVDNLQAQLSLHRRCCISVGVVLTRIIVRSMLLAIPAQAGVNERNARLVVCSLGLLRTRYNNPQRSGGGNCRKTV